MQQPTHESKRPSASLKASRPVRTCAGCGEHDESIELVRVVMGPHSDGKTPLAIDLAGSGFGRGAHVHAQPNCLKKACRGGFGKVFKKPVDAVFDDLAAQMIDSADRRICGLLQGAYRARLLAVGADAAAESLAEGASCLVVAGDAGSVVERGVFASAVRSGSAIAWKTKSALGALFGRDEVAVCAIAHEKMAEEVKRARRVSAAFGSTRSEACWSPEVR